MKILSPLNNTNETIPLIEAGADEIYCGVLTKGWRESYGNVGSINRREWSVSNLNSYNELSQVVNCAHSNGVKVYLTMNALYTRDQYPVLRENLNEIFKIPVDALIVADPGLMLLLKETGWDREIHISTGGTVFNHRTAKFYKMHFNASRVVLPRHYNLLELENIIKKIDFMETECFIFNSGCKNIDGFCTHHHGTSEILKKGLYKIPKKIGLDYILLKALRYLPDKTASSITRFLDVGADSHCLLACNVEPEIISGWDEKQADAAKKWLESTFCIYAGLDPCGACALPRLIDAGITSVKIVGRENPAFKKIMDVKFLKRLINLYGQLKDKKDFKEEAKKIYREIYGVSCREWCYYV